MLLLQSPPAFLQQIQGSLLLSPILLCIFVTAWAAPVIVFFVLLMCSAFSFSPHPGPLPSCSLHSDQEHHVLQQRQRFPVASDKTQLHSAFYERTLRSPNATDLSATDIVCRKFNPKGMLVIFVERPVSIWFKMITKLLDSCYFHSLSQFHNWMRD